MIKQENIVQQKSYAFVIRVVNLYKHLQENKREYTLSKQLLKSGTSIGANIEEAIGGQSQKDFFAKLNIAYKETREAYYWIRLLKDSNYISEQEATSMLLDCSELLKIIGSIIRTIKTNSIPNS